MRMKMLGLVAVAALSLSCLATPHSAAARQQHDRVYVFVWPSARFVLKHAGEPFALRQLPVQVSHKDGDNAVGFELEPGQIPRSYFDPGGLAEVQVELYAADGTVGRTSFSLQRHATLNRWVNNRAMLRDSRQLSKSGATGFRVALDMRSPNEPTTAAKVTDDPRDGGEVDPGGSVSIVVNSTTPVWLTGMTLGCELNETHTSSSTVTTSYPIGGDEAWFTFDSSRTTTTGVAFTVNAVAANFKEEDTKSTTDKWGGDFNKASYARSYRTNIKYGLYSCVNVVTGYRYWKYDPIKQPGGAWDNPLSTRPDWNYCQPVKNLNWWRGQSTGKSYYLSYGTKVKSAIGIDLSSAHSYSTDNRLYYAIPNVWRRVCGSDADPDVARKVMERYGA